MRLSLPQESTSIKLIYMTRKLLIRQIYQFYADGFRQMTVGRTLWAVILIKLFVIFLVLKVFFFPDVLSQKAQGGDKAEVVAKELTGH